MTSGLVLVDDLLVRDDVQRLCRSLQDFSSSGLVASVDSLAHSLDSRTELRAQCRVVRVCLGGLTCTLACLCGICHYMSLSFQGAYLPTPLAWIRASGHTPKHKTVFAGFATFLPDIACRPRPLCQSASEPLTDRRTLPFRNAYLPFSCFSRSESDRESTIIATKSWTWQSRPSRRRQRVRGRTSFARCGHNARAPQRQALQTVRCFESLRLLPRRTSAIGQMAPV